jgi:GTP cyclohydrolase I
MRLFLESLGLDLSDAHLEGTPARVTRMWLDLLNRQPFEWTTFADDADQMVVVRDIPFVSWCAHHLLPFTGVAHVGYVPNGHLVGISKLARVVQFQAQAPQVQERLTEEIADQVVEHLNPRGVGVVLQARHQCMEVRGVQAVGAVTVTCALRGVMLEKPEARAEFMSLIGGARV